jgi:hypothetical protein
MSESSQPGVEVTSTARTFWLGGAKQPTPAAERTPILVVQGEAKALEEIRTLLESQQREFGLHVMKW